MDIFASKNHPDNTINRIAKLEKAVKEIGENATDRIDNIESNNQKFNDQFGASFKRLDTVENTLKTDTGLGDAVKRIESLEKKIRAIPDIQDTMKAMNVNTEKNSLKLDSILNVNINNLENSFETINKQTGVNTKKIASLENDRL